VKVFEKLVCDQLKEFLESNNNLNPFQSGFRKQHSTATAALKALMMCLRHWIKNRFISLMFVDVIVVYLSCPP